MYSTMHIYFLKKRHPLRHVIMIPIRISRTSRVIYRIKKNCMECI